jgi:hypothetical protein
MGGLPDGSQAWSYDVARGTWKRLAPLPTPRSRMRAVEHDGLVYVVGGYVNGAGTGGNSGACEAYDPSTDAWRKLAAMPTPRHGHTVVVQGDRLVVTGGGSGETARAESYDPAKDAWRSFAPCPRVYPEAPAAEGGAARSPFNLLFHEAVSWRGRVLHFGARELPPIPVLAWDPALDTWEMASAQGPLRHRMASARIGAALYLIGGENSASEGPHALRDTLAIDLRGFDRRSR